MSELLASRVGVDTVGGGQILGGAQASLMIDGALWTAVGDAVGLHGGGGGHTSTMSLGVPWLTIDGIPLCVEGNPAACTHVTTGSGSVRVEIP